MVAAPAVADAVDRAHRLKSLHVGLHLVLIDGRPVLPPEELDGLVRRDGRFDDHPLRAGLRFSSDPARAAGSRPRSAPNSRRFRATDLAL